MMSPKMDVRFCLTPFSPFPAYVLYRLYFIDSPLDRWFVLPNSQHISDSFLILGLLWFEILDSQVTIQHSHKKLKYNLEGSLDWVLFEYYYFGWTWLLEDISTQATSEFIKWKHWMGRKIKATVLFMWPTSWNTDISWFCYSDNNLFLVACF